MSSFKSIRGEHMSHEANKDFLHILILSARPLWNGRNTFGEVVHTGMLWNGLEAGISLRFGHKFHAPAAQVVFKDTFVQLVQDVWCESAENVSVGGLPKMESW